MKIEKLEQKFELIYNNYIKKFSKKQKLNFDSCVSDEIGGVAYFGDYSFNFDDIRYDIHTNQKKGLIIEWIDDTVEFYAKGNFINYKSYCMGLRFEHLKVEDAVVNKIENEYCKCNSKNYGYGWAKCYDCNRIKELK